MALHEEMHFEGGVSSEAKFKYIESFDPLKTETESKLE
jgi:hypothetical protein